MKALALTTLIAFALGAGSALAADDSTVAKVDSSKGAITASGGGEFTATFLGQRLKAGDRLMVGEKSRITIKYDNDCEETFKDPGVYTVRDHCTPVAWWGSHRTVAWAVGGALVAGAILYDHNHGSSKPVSR